MRSKIPKKFITILLIIDLTIASVLVYQYNNSAFEKVDEDICEDGRLYSLLGEKWNYFPINYYIDSSIPDDWIDIILEGLSTWDEITEEKLFDETNSPNHATLFIDRGNMGPENSPNERTLAGVLNLNNQGDPATDTTYYSLLRFNENYNFENLDFTCELLPFAYPGPYDLLSITVHELGHVLGLGHTEDEFTTMHTYYTGSFAKTLSQGEIDGFFELYPHLTNPHPN